MEFFVCLCSETCTVILDGNNNLGPNKDESGNLLTKLCNEGLHTITLQCPEGKICIPTQAEIEIKNSNPILPMEVAFQCVKLSMA